MATDWTTAAWFLPLVLPIALWVAWSDMATMKIPNKAVLALLAVFVVVGPIALPFNDYLWRYAHFGVVIVLGFVLSSLGTMGAGDAKFGAAMAPFIARQDVVLFMFLLGATTIAAFLLHRSARSSNAIRSRFPEWESWTRREFPMGFALAPALVFYLAVAVFT
ncbi:MAG: prepilin peptidase [Silicimonas sp.]|jgi:prepilin peptidase CpaA|nr:prepilin peptidase [Silicimonas sp.]